MQQNVLRFPDMAISYRVRTTSKFVTLVHDWIELYDSLLDEKFRVNDPENQGNHMTRLMC